LKGLTKVELFPGETRKITLNLDTRAFAYYDADEKVWLAPQGVYSVLVGSSSDSIELSAPIRLTQTLRAKP
jgi:beta-glucosidase